MEKKISFSEILKKYTMVLVLVLVVIMFAVNTKGVMLLPQNVNNLVAQNAYVFILATGMLFCILTGGNIDLSVGSVVCFVAAVGGKMMVLNSMNPYLTMLVMLLTGIAIGAWQGFWIAYVRIPPFIVTLAGMLAFRGLSNVVLQGQTLAPMPDSYLALFNNYIPDPFGKEGFNLICFVVGIIVCIVYVLLVLKNRADRVKKGYSVDAFGGVAVKMILICVVVLAFMFRLAQYKGIPNSLIWVAVIIAIYTYIASKTTTGRYFYAVGGNEKATKLSGINTNKVYFLAYLNMGLLAAIAGMVTMAVKRQNLRRLKSEFCWFERRGLPLPLAPKAIWMTPLFEFCDVYRQTAGSHRLGSQKPLELDFCANLHSVQSSGKCPVGHRVEVELKLADLARFDHFRAMMQDGFENFDARGSKPHRSPLYQCSGKID